MNEARARLGVSKTTMARLVREGRLTVRENPLDQRQKLVSEAEVAALAEFMPAPKPRTAHDDKREGGA